MLTPALNDTVRAYLDERISLDEFIGWLRPRELSLVGDPDSEDSALVAAIELAHADLLYDLCDETKFRDAVREAWSNTTRAASETEARTLSPTCFVQVQGPWEPMLDSHSSAVSSKPRSS